MKFFNINFCIVLNILGTFKILNFRKTREEDLKKKPIHTYTYIYLYIYNMIKKKCF